MGRARRSEGKQGSVGVPGESIRGGPREASRPHAWDTQLSPCRAGTDWTGQAQPPSQWRPSSDINPHIVMPLSFPATAIPRPEALAAPLPRRQSSPAAQAVLHP